MSDENQKSFRSTLNLPTTDFPLRAHAKTKEPEILERWQQEHVDQKAQELNEGKEKFILFDGPPYANGHIHLGTATNKVLKDIVTKYRRMQGYHVPFRPGWDCHGLPVELKVTAEKNVTREQIAADPIAFKKACRAYAQKWVDTQRNEFKNLGVLAEWNRPYLTMNTGYEAQILRALAIFIDKGHIERKGKTVPWCPSCQTVLATVEIEHKERKDPSCYILFPLAEPKSIKSLEEVVKQRPDLKISMLVWTTTPWTIPLNRAVVLNPKADYVLLAGKDEGQAFIVVKDMADTICKMIGIDKNVLMHIPSLEFEGGKVRHPYVENLVVPILRDDMVLTTSGTGVLHMAPGCGPEDYMTAVRNGIEIFSPLAPDGTYSEGIDPQELLGMKVQDGQIWSVRKMAQVGALLHKESIRHSYPHCWRCRGGLIFRATNQWFCNLEKNDLIEKTLKEIKEIDFVPESGRTRLSSTIGTRTEWCISRQRTWGVPIPSIICKPCAQQNIDCTFMSADFVRDVAGKVAEEGIEYWDRVSLSELKKDGFLPQDFACVSGCGADKDEDFIFGRDILDVWFESGVGHFAVLKTDETLRFPADVYLEGSDQHRGWFQSSLLTSMVINETTCTKNFVTHGFVVDKDGHKMSKSVGNVVAPQQIIDQFSTDILRLWVASSDYEGDIIVSDVLLKNVSEVYRKIRNTARFLLSNLYDFDPEKDAVALEDMLAVDQYAYARLFDVHETIHDAFDKYHFSTVYQALANWCTNDLSAFYLDVTKDRLYTEKADSHMRRSAQTVMHRMVTILNRMTTPILAFLAEELSDYLQKSKSKSIHLQQFLPVVDVWASLATGELVWCAPQDEKHEHEAGSRAALYRGKKESQWNAIFAMRDQVLKGLEVRREEGVVKHPLEAQVGLWLDPQSDESACIRAFLCDLKDVEANRFLKDLFIVSHVEIRECPDGLHLTEYPWLRVGVKHADGTKCPRCWQWEVTDNSDGLCRRCQEVLGL